MYKNLVEITKQLVTIANMREKIQPDGFLKLSDSEFDAYDDTYDKQLEEILMELDYEEVMSIQTIMYLGREKDYKEQLTHDEIFADYKRYIQGLSRRDSKEIEVRQIVEKMPLGKYLTEGYAILGITL